MAITHVTIKAPGQRLNAIADWNAAHATPSINITDAVGNTLIVDTDVFVVDATNDRVGIGTNAPSVELDVIGNIRGTNVQATSELWIGAGADVDSNWELINGHLAYTNYNQDKDLSFTVNTGGILNDLMILDGSLGRVGIGLFVPTHKLHVNGNMRIEDDVGIGVDPLFKLHVDGTFRVSGNSEIGGALTLEDNIIHDDNTTVCTFSGGNATNAGANIALFGGAHATLPNLARIRQDGTTVFYMSDGGHLHLGSVAPQVSAKLELTSTTGALLLTRMTTAQRNALTAINGMILYNSSTNAFNFYENGAWVPGSGLA